MNRTSLNQSWKLRAVDARTLKMQELRSVDLPHDYCIEQQMDPMTAATASNAYLPGGVIEYEKTLAIPEAWRGKAILVEFEGVYMNAIVRLNKSIVGRHPYGYTGFFCDLAPYARYGQDNVLTVTVNNSALPNTRWYSGMGIYRNVWLLTGEAAHVAPWGVFVTTPTAARAETVFAVETNVCSALPAGETVVLRQRLLDASGAAVAQASDDITLSGGTQTCAQTLRLANATLWDVDDPYLYSLQTEILRDGTVLDRQVTRTGVRSISVDAQNGFLLNGRSLKMKGGCVHHDCGILGAASHDKAERRKAALLKQNGFNAVRCAHNPPAPAFLDACDALGLLVIDEAFDCWNEPKMANDYSLFFADWWERDMTAMVLRDRNHPSVVLWSTGNEIPERDGHSDGYALARRLADFVRGLDGTRPVTNALCDLWQGGGDFATATAAFAAPLDVVGFNYLLARYAQDGAERVLCGTETFPMQALDYWEAVEKHPYVIGDFVWTALDYLGEAGIGRVRDAGEVSFVGAYPWSHANCGDIDLCGGKRPQSYFRDCVWGTSSEPYIAVHNPAFFGQDREITPWGWPDVANSWSWPSFEGKPARVDIYSADDEVELFVNGVSQGRKPAGKASRYLAAYEVLYAPGEMVCVGYRGGAEAARTRLVTHAAPHAIVLRADCARIGGGDIVYISAQVVDRDGHPADSASDTLYVTAQGAGSLLAIGSANPRTDERYVGNARRCYRGQLQAVARANGAGTLTVTASAEGLVAATVTVEVAGA